MLELEGTVSPRICRRGELHLVLELSARNQNLEIKHVSIGSCCKHDPSVIGKALANN